MVVSVLVLATLGLMLLVPNYLAVRHAMFGGGTVTASHGGGGAGTAAVRSGNRGLLWLKLTERWYAWKALSPILFAASAILGIGLGGAVGIGLVALAFLNLLWGLTGWKSYIPGKR